MEGQTGSDSSIPLHDFIKEETLKKFKEDVSLIRRFAIKQEVEPIMPYRRDAN